MKLLFVFIPSDCLERCQSTLTSAGVHAYTEIPGVLGAGESGVKLGTRAFPGTTTLILIVLEGAKADALVSAMRTDCESGGDADETRVFAVPAERLL